MTCTTKKASSPWIDNLKRSYITEDTLQKMIADGIRGVTSNPTIFQKSIANGSDYDEQFGALAASQGSVEDAYWELVIKDVTDACHIMRTRVRRQQWQRRFRFDRSLPNLALDEKGTTESARYLHSAFPSPTSW